MNAEVWQCWASTVGVARCGLIQAGLKRMRAVSETRDRQTGKRQAESMQALRKQREAQEHENQSRHPENTRAFEVIIERTGRGATPS